MADRIKIPADFFECEPITTLYDRYGQDADAIVLLYVQLLCETHKKSGKGVFKVADLPLTDELLHAIFRYDDLRKKLSVLQELKLIERTEKTITVFKFWADKRNRNSPRYKEWRTAVFSRDNFQCAKCGTRKDLQAHHIKSWSRNEGLRYSVSNGITLCRKCHLEAHGGCWLNGL